MVLRRNVPLIEFILLYTANVGQSGGVEDAHLWKEVTCTIPATFKSTITYHYFVLARKCILVARGGLALVVSTTLFNVAVKNIEVVVINVIDGKDTGEDIADEFH